jgi:hypothetical protein
MNKHTAGPWIVVQNGKQIDIHHKAIGDREITITTNANEKDARLIAAAPDMLEALKFLVEMRSDPIRFCGCSGARYDVALAAIAKAEGRE